MRLVELAHSKISKVVKKGDICVDATAGNGHDSLFLAKHIHPLGIVYSLDIQISAIKATKRLLQRNKLGDVLMIFHGTHENVRHFLRPEHRGNVSVAMFNLGYLPGGNHEITTTPETTIKALNETYRMVKENGIVSILCYRGHNLGLEETMAVTNHCKQKNWKFQITEGNQNPLSPQLIIIEKIRMD